MTLFRNTLIKAHLYLAAFVAPFVFLVAISGGLYLIDIKGSYATTPVALPEGATIDPDSPTLKEDFSSLLSNAGVDHNFGYVKKDGNTLTTRPTSRTNYKITINEDGLEMQKQVPSFQKRMIELHLGHGPILFKQFQRLMAVGVLLIVTLGLILGLTAANLRISTLVTTGAGLLVFLILFLFASGLWNL